MNHLYIQTAFLGDLLLAVPSLRQIRQWSPSAKLTLVCRKGYGDFFNQLQLVDEIIEVTKKAKVQLATNQLKDRKFSTIFCPHQSTSSMRLVKALKAEQKIGFKKVMDWGVFDKKVARNLTWPEAMRQMQLVAEVDESTKIKLEAFAEKPHAIPDWADMKLNQLSWDRKHLQKIVSKKITGNHDLGDYICIAPGSVWPTKRWTQKSFEKVITLLARENMKVVIIGAPDERQLCEKIQSNTPNSFSFAGHLSVEESLVMMSYAKGLICNDSGAMHMASLLKLPTISIFGPTVVELGYKPWNPNAYVFSNQDLLCRPCGQHGGKSCPIGTHQCMESISAKEVVEKALVMFR